MIRQFFADSDFLTGMLDKNDDRNPESRKIFNHLKKNSLISDIRDLHLSNYIIMEVLHNLQDKKFSFEKIMHNYDILKTCQVFHVKPKEIELAFETKLAPYCNHKSLAPPIGIVDATNLVVMDKKRIGSIISFDSGFDAIPDIFIRIDNVDTINQRILNWYK